MDKGLIKKYLEGDASLDDKEKLVEWVKTDKDNMSELWAIRKLHDIILWQPNLRKRFRQQRKIILYRIASVAAILLLLVGTGVSVYQLSPKMPDPIMQTIHVPPGQRVELILADGTNVWLNAGTTFIFPNIFSPKNREVTLEGEAYFNVTENKTQPFIVKTPSHDIKVLGTEFNVLTYKNLSLFEVALLSGSVEVFSPRENKIIRLEPNTKVSLYENKLKKEYIYNYDYFLWKDGLICFDDETLEEMVDKLERYYDIKIFVENKTLKNKKYTGKFRIKDGVEHILNVFKLKDPFDYERVEDTNVITIK